tara:strand:- start:2002 stop:2325 length:324 start_codon:yes stop_codon:yes gene_type:complete
MDVKWRSRECGFGFSVLFIYINRIQASVHMITTSQHKICNVSVLNSIVASIKTLVVRDHIEALMEITFVVVFAASSSSSSGNATHAGLRRWMASVIEKKIKFEKCKK